MTPPPTVPLPFVDDGLGNSSYLVDLGDGRALVVDPERDPSPYLAAAEGAGLEIAFAAETHLHADFVSGSGELAAFGAEVLAPAAGGLETPHQGLGDGELAGGIPAWEAAGLGTATIPLVEPGRPGPGRPLDVRQDAEFAAGHLPGAAHVELGRLGAGSWDSADLPRGPLTVNCGHGERAMTAASVLAAAGRRDLSVLVGGPDDWAAATGRSLER